MLCVCARAHVCWGCALKMSYMVALMCPASMPVDSPCCWHTREIVIVWEEAVPSVLTDSLSPQQHCGVSVTGQRSLGQHVIMNTALCCWVRESTHLRVCAVKLVGGAKIEVSKKHQEKTSVCTCPQPITTSVISMLLPCPQLLGLTFLELLSSPLLQISVSNWSPRLFCFF